MTRLMVRADKVGLRWRRAYADDDQVWSVPDQLGSLLQAAGGRPHRVTLDGRTVPWSIGVDASHPGGAEHSTICAALVDPDGLLVQAWTMKQPRNEQVSAVVLRRLLREAAEHAREKDPDADLLVLRDGRLFDRENARFYRQGLAHRVTLVEVRKGGNPPVAMDDFGTVPTQPLHALVEGVGDDHYVGFLVNNPEARGSGLPRTLKLHWRSQWDGLELGTADMPRVLFALSVSAGLGLRRRSLPAPLYWADGIAAANDTDQRFRGQPVIELT